MAKIEEQKIYLKIQFATIKEGKKLVLSSNNEQNKNKELHCFYFKSKTTYLIYSCFITFFLFYCLVIKTNSIL